MPAPFLEEFRRRAVKLAREGHKPIVKLAEELRVSESGLRRRMPQADIDDGAKPGVTSDVVRPRNLMGASLCAGFVTDDVDPSPNDHSHAASDASASGDVSVNAQDSPLRGHTDSADGNSIPQDPPSLSTGFPVSAHVLFSHVTTPSPEKIPNR